MVSGQGTWRQGGECKRIRGKRGPFFTPVGGDTEAWKA